MGESPDAEPRSDVCPGRGYGQATEPPGTSPSDARGPADLPAADLQGESTTSTGPPSEVGDEGWIPFRVCNYTWRGPRGDVPESLDVNHVCCQVKDHGGEHWCSCEATCG